MIRIGCRLKEAGEVIQLDKLAFCLAHPALHRKLNFALRLKHAGWIGGSIDVPLEQRGDIYIDAADSTATEAWLDPVKAQGWVLAQLKAQGIAVEVGVGHGSPLLSRPCHTLDSRDVDPLLRWFRPTDGRTSALGRGLAQSEHALD